MMHARRAAIAGLVAWTGLSACGADELPPEGQFVVHVTTDAPLPAGFAQPSSDTVSLFHRLSVEVFAPGATEPCESCRREFEVDQSMVDDGTTSVGIVPPRGRQGVRLRVRLFRADIDAPAPRVGSTLERVVILPLIPDEGIEHVTVTLWTEDVGRPVGTLEAPVEAERGNPSPGLVGSWSGSRREPCVSQPAADEVCLPGGPFWLGDPRLDLAGATEFQGRTERLVVLSPFHLDRTEVSVGAFRASGLAEENSGGVFNPTPARAGSYCTYEEEPGARDQLPVNCLTWRLARAFCEQQGKRLPTEAELAYAASALGVSSYVWGEETPACADAIFARANDKGACAAWGLGPAAVDSGRRDRLSVASGEAVDLAGNVSEFAADFWQLDDEPCWSGPGVLLNPKCDIPSLASAVGRTVRGGSYVDPPLFLRAALRTVVEGESMATSPAVGFRCARDD